MVLRPLGRTHQCKCGSVCHFVGSLAEFGFVVYIYNLEILKGNRYIYKKMRMLSGEAGW